jgi:hypothetical protein
LQWIIATAPGCATGASHVLLLLTRFCFSFAFVDSVLLTLTRFCFRFAFVDSVLLSVRDMEDTFAVDHRDGTGVCDGCKSDGGGGYCVLSCNTFNTPMFCDKDHPQDRFQQNDGR